MAFCNDKEQLYLERDVLDVGLGAGFLQVGDGIQFPRNEAPISVALWLGICEQEPNKCKNPLQQYRNGSSRHIPWARKFHHYCFTCEVNMIKGQKTTDCW